jgi:Fe-S cluster biogenesis protein NfuA
MDHYESGEAAVSENIVSDTTIFDDDDEVVQMIKELLEVRIRPAVQEDGGDIKFVGWEESSGVVSVRLEGSCVGCPSSSVTLKSGVENMLMHYIPEVTGVVSVEETPDDDENAEYPKHDYGVGDVKIETTEAAVKAKTYEEKLAQAGIPFSD